MSKRWIRNKAFEAFCSGNQELYDFLQEQARHGSKSKFHIGKDWQLAKTLQRQANSLGWGCGIQKRYAVPAKRNNWSNYKKYKGLNWKNNGCPDWTHIYIGLQFPDYIGDD